MNGSPYLIQIYIHPDKGPITPVILNILEIENKVIHLPINVNRDEARVQEIIMAITKVLPNVDPWSKTRELSQLVRSVSQISTFEQLLMYQGIVIRLPGTIENNDFYSCFISYSSKDHDFVERLYTDLQSNNVRCWFAPEDMKTGDVIRSRIDEAIRVHDKLLLVLSQHSVESSWVEKEVETAFEKERQQKRHVLFPVRLDDVVMQTSTSWAADIRRMRHITDFTDWKEHDAYQKAFNRLLRNLKAET
jgi:ribosomal protein S28E/S33